MANKQCIIHGVFVGCVLLHAVTPYPKHKGITLYLEHNQVKNFTKTSLKYIHWIKLMNYSCCKWMPSYVYKTVASRHQNKHM